ERRLGHVGEILEQLGADPHQPLAEIAVPGPAERHQMMSAWNATATTVPHTAGVLEAIARNRGVAVVAGAVELTYEQLDEQANRLAHLLRRAGGGPRGVGGPWGGGGPGRGGGGGPGGGGGGVGVGKGGGAYLPLDPQFPPDRLRYLVADSGVSVVVGDSSGAGTGGATIVRLDGPALASMPATAPGAPAGG